MCVFDTAYAMGDVVYHDGSSWFALAPSTNQEPGATGSESTWDLVALAGSFLDYGEPDSRRATRDNNYT